MSGLALLKIQLILSLGMWTISSLLAVAESRRDRADAFHSQEERLHNGLFRKYNSAIRPVRKATEPVQVSLTFSLKQIHTLDEKAQMFRTYGWLIVVRRSLVFIFSALVNVMLLNLIARRSYVWSGLQKQFVEFQFPDFSQYRVTVSHTGLVRWEPAGVFETSCKIDITFYPYDEQVCSLVFGTWTYTSYKLNMTNSTGTVVQDDYNTSGEWHITGTAVARKEFIYTDDPHIRFSKIDASIHLKRRHRFYTMNLVLPCAMLSSLTLVTFLSPPDQGEKISLGISILLSFSVFMLQLSENMPKTSETLPLFGVYTTFVMLMNTWSVMLTVLILNLHHRNEERPVPKWVRTLVFDGLARILCMYTKDHIRNDNYRNECGLFSSREYYKSYRKRSNTSSALNSVSNDRYRSSSLRKKDSVKDSYSLSYAAAQFTGKMRKSSIFVPSASLTSSDTNNLNSNSQCHSNSRETYRDSNKTSYNTADDYKKELESLLPREQLVTIELQEWKRVSRIVDRLFFWLTLLALISVSVALVCLLWAN